MITPAPDFSAARARPAWWPMALLAIVAPTLIAAHEPPSVTFYNQVLAVLGWGLLVAVLARQGGLASARALTSSTLAINALGLVGLVCAVQALGSAFWWGQLPAGLGLMGGGMSLAALLVLRAGWHSGRSTWRDAVLEVFFGCLTLAGVLGMVLALIQVFHPAWADGQWIAEPTMAGRAVGNLRQPNHFSTMLVWACCGAGWLGARRRLPAWLASALIALFIWGIVLTASRTGMIGMVFLALWGLLDKRLPRLLRACLIGAPLIYGLCWGGMSLWAHADKSVAFAAEARLHDKSDISSSRFKIWANVLELIRLHPWQGLGYGEFNVAWTLTPFPTRPVAFFDHTHSLPLQWAVEFGLPVALVLIAASLLAYVTLLRGQASPATLPPNQSDAGASATIAACGVMVSIAGLHSLLEYPLWYSYFLLPCAFAWGTGLGTRASGAAGEPFLPSLRAGSAAVPKSRAMLAGGLIMALLAVWCTVDYRMASNIYAPRKGAGPLDKRIALSQRMPWWGHQADYADVTTTDDDDPSRPPAAFKRTLHNLLDARLMIAYARSLAEHGEVDKARYVVARLKEFHNTMGDTFLAVCKAQPEPGEAPPFQCEPPKQAYTWRQILPP